MDASANATATAAAKASSRASEGLRRRVSPGMSKHYAVGPGGGGSPPATTKSYRLGLAAFDRPIRG
jgi:hypothetical protein